MKKLLLLLALFAISCEKKSEPFPVKVISESLEFRDDIRSWYLFTFRNEGDGIIDSFTVTIQLYEDGLQATDSRVVREELVPFQTTSRLVGFEYSVKNDSDVTFKYKFK